MRVVTRNEFTHSLAHGLQIAEDTVMDCMLIEGTVETFRHAVGLGFGHECRTGGDAPEFDLVEEVIGHVLGAMIKPQGEPPCHVGTRRAEVAGQHLGDGFQGGEAVADLRVMPAHAFGVEMIDRRETQTQPSSTVSMRTPSVPHIASGAEVMIVPVCGSGVPLGVRCGESSASSCITRQTRFLATPMPARRSRAQTLRRPSPTNGEGRQVGPDGREQIGVAPLW